MLEKQRTTSRQFMQGSRLASVTASGRATLPTLGETREVRVHASAACRITFGDSAITAAVDGLSIPLPADCPEVMIVPASATHFAVIRDSADGFVTLTPVA